jgi:uncharacterized protein
MKIRVDDIPEDGLHLSFSGDEEFLSDAINAVSIPGDVKIDPHIEGKVDLFRSDEDVLLLGTVVGSMNLMCSRCISEFIVVKQVNLDLKFRVGGIENEFRQSAELQEQDVMFLKSAELDPAEIILQELLLEIPMKPLCREDCAGLCPKCGALKGSPECKCGDARDIDPRWEALAGLAKKLDDHSPS